MNKGWFSKSPRAIKWAINLFPPLLFSGIAVTYISSDFRHCKIKLKNWPGTRNANGTQFGGSLFSMSDGVFGILLLCILGWNKYYVWDKRAKISFDSPGVGTLYLEIEIPEDVISTILEETRDGNKHFTTLLGHICDKRGKHVAS
ncbi:MAG: DUF4442 domain-containing protein, partial [Neisseriaceae bacterium]